MFLQCFKQSEKILKLNSLRTIGSAKIEKELDIVKILKTLRYLKEFVKNTD